MITLTSGGVLGTRFRNEMRRGFGTQLMKTAGWGITYTRSALCLSYCLPEL